jgi:Uma2 family endonuclease
MAIQILRWQFTVADFARMVEAGILAEDDRVELIDGEVRAMSPIGPRHVAIVNRLNALLSRQVADRAIVSVQNPIQLTDYTEPQPDIAVLRPREDFYAQALPLPEDVLLVVEVAETSLEYDRDEKIPRYAQTRIPEVWLIEVEQVTVTQYTHPDGTRYRRVQTLARGQFLSADILGPLHCAIDSIFG